MQSERKIRQIEMQNEEKIRLQERKRLEAEAKLKEMEDKLENTIQKQVQTKI